jgi:nitrogenase molybdenum-iron protein beta chain
MILPLSLHQRSSIYGASLVASEFDDSNIVIWGPRGCTSQVLEAMNTQRQQFDYYHYAVTEADILTNGISTLKEKLLPMVEGCINKGPLFLFLGDATQLTSEDVEGFVNNNISDKFPIVYVETGFKGDSYYGINETLFKVFKRLCKEPKSKDTKLINLIPEVGLSPQWRSDAIEISRILEALGFKVNIIPNRSSIKKVSEITEASLTILLNRNIGNKAASYLKDKYGIPVFATNTIPVGFLGTKLWLEQLNEFLGGTITGITDLVQEEEQNFYTKVRPGLREENYNIRVNKIRLSKFVICDELFRAKEWSRVLKEEFCFEGGYVFPTTKYEGTMDDKSYGYLHGKVEVFDDLSQLLEKFTCEDTILILASDWVNELNENGFKDKLVISNNPVIKKIVLESCPYMGFKGMTFLLQDILNSIEY